MHIFCGIGLRSQPYFLFETRRHLVGESGENPYIVRMNESEHLLPSEARPPSQPARSTETANTPTAMAPNRPPIVPIRSLGENHRSRIASHLVALDPHDRYLRFGYAANDEQILRYVAGLDFDRDEIFGIYNRKLVLLAVAHLAYPSPKVPHSSAEFGVSVTKLSRGRGYGARLFERAAMHARNDGIEQLYIHALSENSAMIKIVRDAGALITRDGSESDAYLRLPPATLDSQVTEIVQEQFAQADYRFKSQAKQFWSCLAGLRQASDTGRSGDTGQSSDTGQSKPPPGI